MLEDIASNPNVKNWASMVKNTLSNLGFYHVWAYQGVGNVKNVLTIFKQSKKISNDLEITFIYFNPILIYISL